jgi:hypothetical protein
MKLSVGTKTNKGIIQKAETIYTINNKQYKEHELSIDNTNTKEHQLKLLKEEIYRLVNITMENTNRTNLIIQYAETLNRIDAECITCITERHNNECITYVMRYPDEDYQELIAEYSVPT